ncbi:hypothetical protein MPL1032_230178 [Mesorhizobium plurifarium]|uniref:Uncharacterized protein n=1 Tax=Mesorhizobium plurifarium TaxID=69974 RepID=A0A0K2VZN5_MESPL|nr:hypothetical protein MPL1032_230178 [Mesorhizobium plurifarium]
MIQAHCATPDLGAPESGPRFRPASPSLIFRNEFETETSVKRNRPETGGHDKTPSN